MIMYIYIYTYYISLHQFENESRSWYVDNEVVYRLVRKVLTASNDWNELQSCTIQYCTRNNGYVNE